MVHIYQYFPIFPKRYVLHPFISFISMLNVKLLKMFMHEIKTYMNIHKYIEFDGNIKGNDIDTESKMFKR